MITFRQGVPECVLPARIFLKLNQQIDLVVLIPKTTLLVPNEAWKGSKNPIFGLRRQKNGEQKVQGPTGITRADDRHSEAVLKGIWDLNGKQKLFAFNKNIWRYHFKIFHFENFRGSEPRPDTKILKRTLFF